MSQLFDLGPTRAIRPEERSDAPTPSLGELARASYDDAIKVTNFDSMSKLVEEGYDSVNDRIKAATGEELENPTRWGAFSKLPPHMRVMGGEAWTPEFAQSAWNKRIAELKAKAPDALPWDDLVNEPLVRAGETMRQARQRQEEAMTARGMVDKSHLGVLGQIPILGSASALAINVARDPAGVAAQFGGSLAGQMTSPADAIANLLPFGVLQNQAAKSLIKNAAANAAANAGIQAVLSAGKMEDYKKAGLPYGWKVWLEEVEGAAATGAVLDLAIRGPGRAAIRRFGTDTPAGTTFSRNTERGGLFTDAPDRTIAPEVFQKAQEGDIAAAREIAEKTGAINDPAIKGAFDYLEGTGRLTDEALAELEKMGIVRPDGFRVLSDAIEGRVPEMPEPVRPATEPLMREEGSALVRERAGELEALMREASPLLTGGHPRLAQFIEDAVEAGSARYVTMVREALDGVRAGRAVAEEARSFVAKLQEIVRENPERFAAEVELRTSTSPLAIADSVRRFPEIVDSNTALETDIVRMGRSIARLDDAAYGHAQRGLVPPQVAAMVAERVPRQHQGRVMEDLAKARPETLEEARALVDELVPEARTEAVPLDGGGERIDDPNGAAAKAQAEVLKQEAGRAYEEAAAPVVKRQELESQVETIKGEIAKLEEAAAQALPRFVDPETGVEISPTELASIKDMWAFVREMKKTKAPQSLVDFLRERGGLIDEGTEISTIIDGARSRPGLISKKGQALDDAALAAWEAGFFESADRPTISDFLEAVRRDISGDRVIRAADASLMEDIRVAREMESELDEIGVAKAKTEADIDAHFQPREGGSGPRGGQEAARGEGAESPEAKLAAKRAELAEAEAQLDQVRGELRDAIDGQRPVLRDTEPTFADGAPISEIRRIVESGETYRVSDEAIEVQFDAALDYADALPAGSRFGVWLSIGPGAQPGEAHAVIRTLSGDIGFTADLGTMLASRAFYHPHYDFIVPSSISSDSAAREIASGIYHEIVHAHWRRFDSADRVRLAAHAENLRVMDMEFSEFLWTIGDPSWVHAAPGETLRTRYNEMYAGRANIQDQLAQEAVAHMQELHYAGFLSDADVAPVLDDLMRMRGGAESRSLTGGGDPLFALDASTGQSMRRDLDALGYYSQALEAAKSWNQKKGTPEQALMWLKKSGVKDAEIEATGLRAFLEGKQSVTRDEVVAHLEGNRVGLTERRYSNEIDDTKPPVRRVYRDDYGGFRTDDEPVMAPGVVGEPHWQSFSLDPDNPTYRETVLHLPAVQKNDADAIAAMIDRGEITAEEWQRRYQASGLYDAGARETAFRSGHFSEPNIIGHMMTSMTTHQGKPVYTIDQIQSDWGQKIRDSGAQDPERSAELKQALDAERERVADILKEANAAVPSEKRASLMDLVSHNMGPHALLRITTSLLLDHIRGHERGFVGRLIKGAPNNRLKELGDELEAGVTNLRRLEAEYAQSRQSAPGNPLVNTTDQWVNTTLRRAIRQAAEADADYIAIPRGDTVLSYNPEGPDGPNGMRVFYGRSDKEGIVPKNLRNILERMDKDSARPMPVEALTTPTKGVTNRGDLRISDGGSDFGFTLFPLTDKVKQSVMKEGQPLFAIKAFHGSPHEFNAFKMDAIGTGEGAQAFGHGLYFAESKTVANFYREGLSAGVRARQVFDELGTRFPAARDAIEAAYGDLDDAITILQRDGGKTAEIDAITRAKSEIESAKSGGHLYEVSIKEDADKFLDWDKPLGEQTAFVRKALGIDDFAKVDDGSILKAFAKAASKEDGHAPTIDLAYDAYAAMAQNKGRAPLDFRGFERALLDSGFRIGRFAGADRVIGMQVDNVPEVNKHLASPAMMPRDFIRRVGKGEDQSKYFTDRGIPGVRYLDANSRGMIIGDKYAETGTRNIVVFDDSLVRITSKNGEPFIRQEVIDALKPKRSEPLAALRGNRPSDRLDTPEFKSWFGDSKVVDESGKPLVMYHGTARAGFDFFDTYASNYGLMGMGGYFTENPDVAGGYTNKGAKKMERQGRDPTPAIYPVYLSIKNPIDMDAPADIAAWSKVGNEYGADFTDGMTNEQAYRELESALQDEQMPSYEGAEIMQDALRDMGFDGITHVGGGRVDAAGVRHRVFIAFDPEQIKSVNNQGTFSPTDQRILFALSREPPAPPIKSDIAFVDRLNQIKDLVEACRA